MSAANGDKLRIAITWRSSISGDQVNVIDTEVVDAIAPIADADVLEGVANYAELLYDGTEVRDGMPTTTVHYGIHVRNMTTGLVTGEIGAISALNGLASGQPMASGVSAMVLLRTALPRTVGRKYLPTFETGTLADGRWTSTIASRMGAYGNALMADVDTDMGFSLIARVRSSSPVAYNAIINTQASLVPAYQRRRKEGRGS